MSGTDRKPYRRSTAQWWKRDPFFMAYMGRELTALGVLAYSITLAVGLWRLSQGPVAWAAYVSALQSPLSLLWHGLLLLCMMVHAWSWFVIMPKTMPALRWRGQPVPQICVTWTATAAAALCTVVLLLCAAF